MKKSVQPISNSPKVVYYAHSKNIYGTTEERAQLKWLRSHFTKVICPNKDLGELGDIKYYLDFIEEKCDGVVFSEWFDLVGRGVWDEVSHARKLKLPIFGLRSRSTSGEYNLFRFRKGKVVNKNDWRNYAKLVCENTIYSPQEAT